jgi:transcriptional regulator with XRE-family HTH domain
MRWENGQNYPKFKTLDLVCQAFGMTPEELGFAPTTLPVKTTEETPAVIRYAPQLPHQRSNGDASLLFLLVHLPCQ